MTLKPDAVSEGFRGVIYDNVSQGVVWRCMCFPHHETRAEAKTCARLKLKTLQRRLRRSKK